MKLPRQFQIVLAGAVLAALAASAQDRLSVPLNDPSRPATLVLSLLRGNLTIKGYSGKEILIESSPDVPGEGARAHRSEEIPQGMHRVDNGTVGLEAMQANNLVTVQAGRRTGAITVQVPANTSLKLHQTSGRVDVDGVSGEIDVNTVNGDIHVNGVSAALLAHSTNGKITAAFRQLPPAQPVNVSTMNGDINLTLPADSKAKLVMKTENGEILTDFDLKIDASATPPAGDNKRESEGKNRGGRGRTLTGTINGGGGGNIEITSYNGRVTIGKAK